MLSARVHTVTAAAARRVRHSWPAPPSLAALFPWPASRSPPCPPLPTGWPLLAAAHSFARPPPRRPSHHPPAQPPPTAPASTGFPALGITHPGTLDALPDLTPPGAPPITAPTAIQTVAIPPILKGSPTLVASETGAGKTLAYALPLAVAAKAREAAVGRPTLPGRPSVVVLAPTRELATQVLGVWKRLGRSAKLRVAGAVGGEVGIGRQLKDLVGGRRAGHSPATAGATTAAVAAVDVVVGTPSRVAEVAAAGGLSWSALRTVVVDEADVLLGATRGFGDVLEPLLAAWAAKGRSPAAATPTAAIGAAADASGVGGGDGSNGSTAAPPTTLPTPGVQMVYVAATVPRKLQAALVAAHPGLVLASTPGLHRAANVRSLRVTFVRVSGPAAARTVRLVDTVAGLVDSLSPTGGKIMVFCNTIASARAALDALTDGSHPRPTLGPNTVVGCYGTQSAAARGAAWAAFARGDASVIVCTDVVSRGVDDPAVRAVVMADVPRGGADYLHRVGRLRGVGQTGDAGGASAAGAGGRVVVLVAPRSAAVARALYELHAGGRALDGVDAQMAWRRWTAGLQHVPARERGGARARAGGAEWVDARNEAAVGRRDSLGGASRGGRPLVGRRGGRSSPPRRDAAAGRREGDGQPTWRERGRDHSGGGRSGNARGRDGGGGTRGGGGGVDSAWAGGGDPPPGTRPLPARATRIRRAAAARVTERGRYLGYMEREARRASLAARPGRGGKGGEGGAKRGTRSDRDRRGGRRSYVRTGKRPPRALIHKQRRG